MQKMPQSCKVVKTLHDKQEVLFSCIYEKTLFSNDSFFIQGLAFFVSLVSIDNNNVRNI